MAKLKEQIEKVTLDSLKELKERADNGETLSPEENAQLGEFMRFIYLEDGENIILLNEDLKRKKGTRKNGDVVYTYVLQCENSKGRFDLWLTSFDSCAFVVPYNKSYNNKSFNCKPKSINLDDINAVGSATQLLRKSKNQLDFIFKLIDNYADSEGKVRLNVKRHQVGKIDKDTAAGAEVAVQFEPEDASKPYSYKENGKILFEIDLVKE